MMRTLFWLGAFLWFAECLWLPAAVDPGRWQTVLWSESAAFHAAVPEPLARIPQMTENGAFAAASAVRAGFSAAFGPDDDGAGRVLRRAGRSAARLRYAAALGFECRLVMKRTGMLLVGFMLALPFLLGAAADASARRRIRSEELHAPKPVLFNACALGTIVGSLAVGFALPWPMPFPVEVWGLVPIVLAWPAHRAVVHYHRYV